MAIRTRATAAPQHHKDDLVSKRPTAEDITATAKVAGVPVTADVATRIANSIGPAFDGFAPISGTLPFDIEPSTYVVVQVAGDHK
jgi:hypothetical protein